LNESNIYILDNSNYTDKNGIKHSHDGFQELNESNVTLFMDNRKVIFSRDQKIPEGELEIKIIFHIKLTNCQNMFYGCKNITSIDLSSFDTTSVTDMSYMFYGCSDLKEINLSNINTKKVTNISFMFWGCGKLENLDLSSFDTKKVTDMNNMFYCCSHLSSINISSFNTENVIDMSYMFTDVMA